MIEPAPIPAPLLAPARDAAKTYLRIDQSAEDALIDQLIADAASLAEAFTAQQLLQRDVVETLGAGSGWQRLSSVPVRSITGVEGVPAEGGPFPLPVGSYAIDIDAHGQGWVRVTTPGAAGRIRVMLRAGLSTDWAGLPEPVRLGIIRLTAHLYTHRDAADDVGPPAAVAALLRPWRRLRLA
ncbi:MAG: phage head-tail connector protein [Chakrabartia godavariana]